MKTFKLTRALRWSVWRVGRGSELGICNSDLERSIAIPTSARTIWVTFSKTKLNNNSLRILRGEATGWFSILVDGRESSVYPFLRRALVDFGLPCWATVEYG